jgi:uncharacterized protein YoxC
VNTPFFWLGISLLLVAISLMALLSVAILALRELARAARSAEKLLDSLNRELPATLKDLRLTGKELADEVSGSMQSARSVVQQVDQSLSEAKAQAQKAQITTRSLLAGATAAFQVLTRQPRRRRTHPPTRRPSIPPPPEAQNNSHNRPPSSQPIHASDPSDLNHEEKLAPIAFPTAPTAPTAHESQKNH